MSRYPACVAALLLAIAAAGPITEVQARSCLPAYANGDDQDPPEGFQPRLSAESGVLCVKQCPNDQLPCDPPSYKVADGRCSTQWR